MFKLVQVLSIFILLATVFIILNIVWWVFKVFALIFGYGVLSIMIFAGIIYWIVGGFVILLVVIKNLGG